VVAGVPGKKVRQQLWPSLTQWCWATKHVWVATKKRKHKVPLFTLGIHSNLPQVKSRGSLAAQHVWVRFCKLNTIYKDTVAVDIIVQDLLHTSCCTFCSSSIRALLSRAIKNKYEPLALLLLLFTCLHFRFHASIICAITIEDKCAIGPS